MAEATVAENNWQYNRTVLERNKYMLENQLATDVTFLVGENPVPAHQYVLISGSPVFYSMFCGDMRERGEVKVPDISPDTFTQMLRYLYYEEAHITGESVMQILYGSKKYLVPGLTKICTDFLENNLSGENAVAILEQCLLFDEKEMVSKCMKVIAEETAEVLKSENFGKVSNETLVKILENDSCSVSEVELFHGSVDWARRKISKKTPSGDMVRSTLGKALFKLRFPVMTIEEFADEVAPTDILTKEEEVLCFRYFAQKKKPTTMPFPTIRRVDNSCKYIHLTTDENQVAFTTKQTTHLHFTIHNNTSKDLSIEGFVTYGNIPYLHNMDTELLSSYAWIKVEVQPQSVDVCSHTKGKICITFPVFKIPARKAYKIQMNSVSDTMKCTQSDSGLTFTNPTNTISVLVKGDIHISEILIAKSTT